MTVLNGQLLGIYYGDSAVGLDTNASLSIKRGTRDTSNKNSGRWTNKEGGRLDWSGNSEGLVSIGENFDKLFDLIEGDAVTVKFCEQEEDENGDMKPKVGGSVRTGKAIITSLEINAPDNENSTYSISLEGAGKLAKGTIPAQG